MRLRKPLLILVALPILVVFALLSLGTDRYAPKVASLISANAQKNGLMISFVEPGLSLTSFSATQASLFFPRAFLPLSLEQPKVSLSLLSLLLLSPHLQIFSNLYSGELTAMIAELSQARPRIESLNASRVKIGEHPWAQSFGITAELNGSATKLVFAEDSHPLPTSGEISLSLFPFEKPEKNEVKLAALNLPFTVSIPPIHNGKIKLDASFIDQSVTIKDFHFSSWLGEFNGSGLIKLSQRPKQTDLNLSLQINLTKVGSDILGVYLVLLSPKLSSQDTRVSLKVVGDVRSPQISAEAL